MLQTILLDSYNYNYSYFIHMICIMISSLHAILCSLDIDTSSIVLLLASKDIPIENSAITLIFSDACLLFADACFSFG